MKSQMNLPNTLQQAVVYFSDAARALAYAINLRWPDGITCPRCGHGEHSFIKTRRIWFCKGCKKQFTIKVGTIFEDSPIGIDKWMTAFWMIVNCRNGVSSYEIARTVGVTQKSAWFMLHRIRLAMQDTNGGGKLGGRVEVDETFIGGKARNMHARKRIAKGIGSGGEGKTIVLGILERGGKVRTMSARLFNRPREGRGKRGHLSALARAAVDFAGKRACALRDARLLPSVARQIALPFPR